MQRVLGRTALGLLLLPATAFAQPLSIEHTTPTCVRAGRHPRLVACIEPGAGVFEARAFFRGNAAGDWFFVAMQQDGKCFEALLPRPNPSVRTIEYYFEALDATFASARTRPYSTVVARAEACSRSSVERADVSVRSARGTGLRPRGFEGLHLGEKRSGAGLAVVVAGGAAVAGAAVALVAKNLADGSSSTTSTSSVPQSSTTTTPTAAAAACSLRWASDLRVAGGVAQLAIGGTAAAAGSGLVGGVASVPCGGSRIEAVFTHAGPPGSWRLGLGGDGLEPGSVRAIFGDVIQVTPDSATFRVQGRAGERIVLDFVVRR